MASGLNNLKRVDMPLNKETKPNQTNIYMYVCVCVCVCVRIHVVYVWYVYIVLAYTL